MPRNHSRTIGVLGLFAGFSAFAAEPPKNDPPQPPIIIETSPQAEQTIELPRTVVVPSGNQATLEPVRPGLTPPAAADLGLSTAPGLLREGSYITGARARLAKGKSGKWYAIFDQEAEGRVLPPMILAENSNLAAMERSAERSGAETRYRVAGRVTVYHNRNYLLASMPPMIDRGADSAPPPAPSAASDSSKPRSADPTIEQIVAELDKAAGGAANRSKPSGNGAETSAASEPSAESEKRIAAAGFLTNRRTRMVRVRDGRLAASFDAGAAGAAAAPMVILPCQNLAAIEAVLDTSGDGATFTMSGEVVVYRGKNYVLPTMYVVNKQTDIVMPAH